MYNTWNRERRKWSGAAALLAKNFQLGDGFQILGAARRALDLNQSVQTEATTRNPEDREIDAIGKQGLVACPRRMVSASHWNGKPGGAPRRYGEQGLNAEARRAMFSGVRE